MARKRILRSSADRRGGSALFRADTRDRPLEAISPPWVLPSARATERPASNTLGRNTTRSHRGAASVPSVRRPSSRPRWCCTDMPHGPQRRFRRSQPDDAVLVSPRLHPSGAAVVAGRARGRFDEHDLDLRADRAPDHGAASFGSFGFVEARGGWAAGPRVGRLSRTAGSCPHHESTRCRTARRFRCSSCLRVGDPAIPIRVAHDGRVTRSHPPVDVRDDQPESPRRCSETSDR
jgi:hypothetical protein